jgi:hypothetical protein
MCDSVVVDLEFVNTNQLVDVRLIAKIDRNRRQRAKIEL